MAPKQRSERCDEAIMNANGSSIVSKRSVERIYLKPEEHRFLRYFVAKPQRRSPLINRGYWLRMQAIEHVVESFLSEKLPAGKRKVVVNLGCGFDPLLFRHLSNPLNPSNVTYVDIDYPTLMARKASTISKTPDLTSILPESQYLDPPIDHIHYRSRNYLALGCDLRDLTSLQEVFGINGLVDAAILFVAEVSLTWMDVDAVDALVEWAATLPDARFSILEQMIPCGPSHPFARQMLRHFNSISTPLKSVFTYPTLSSQVSRYSSRGWTNVHAVDLHGFWSSVITKEQKAHVESVECFDEWEEFILFCQHYFLLYARNKPSKDEGPLRAESLKGLNGTYCKYSEADGRPRLSRSSSSAKDLNREPEAAFTPSPGFRRRFGAAAAYGKEVIYQGGIGSTTRLGASVLISTSAHSSLAPLSGGPGERMCHTMSPLSGGKVLLVGGRASPGEPLGDVWLLDSGIWRRVQDLPSARYRHCATVAPGDRVIVHGGKGNNNKVLGDWLQWTEYAGWTELVVDHETPLTPRFGASLYWFDKGFGLLSGGMDQTGEILGDLWRFDLGDGIVIPRWSLANMLAKKSLFKRFGAQTVSFGVGYALLIGGVSGDGLAESSHDIVELNFFKLSFRAMDVRFPSEGSPLLIGHAAVAVSNEPTVAIIGGGGVCFSMRDCFTEGIWTLKRGSGSASKVAWITHVDTKIVKDEKKVQLDPNLIPLFNKDKLECRPISSPAGINEVAKVRINSKEDFRKIIEVGQPVLIKGSDIGCCIANWDPEYLKNKIGPDRKVVVHAARSQSMSFIAKNFNYEHIPFSSFIDAASSSSELMYLRSLSTSRPKSAPTKLSNDFPEIAEDFVLPEVFEFAKTNEHSSPLRISSKDVGMWLHFDVMANILVHIRGRKRLRLYPPTDVTHLSFPHGASSSTLMDPFNSPPPGTHPYEVLMEPGDILYIPEFWPHAALPLEFCVAVNVFFRNLGDAYSPGKDVYGNKDLKAYENGRSAIAKMLREFEGLPDGPRRFYLERLAEELTEAVSKAVPEGFQ